MGYYGKVDGIYGSRIYTENMSKYGGVGLFEPEHDDLVNSPELPQNYGFSSQSFGATLSHPDYNSVIWRF